MKNTITNLYNGDCIAVMKQLISEGVQVDCIITDLPYGTTPCSWDIIIPFDEMWECINKIIKPNGAILLFGQEPFSSLLRASNIKNYKYDWYWKKERLTNVFQVKRRPGKVIENISVFYKKQPIYNPQKTKYDGPPRGNKIGDGGFSITQTGGGNTKPIEYVDDGTRYPLQIVEFNRDSMYDEKYHPTQKPIELLEYLKQDEFLKMVPPKSTGREQYSVEFMEMLSNKFDFDKYDKYDYSHNIYKKYFH